MEPTSVAAAQISAQSHAKIGPILDAAVGTVRGQQLFLRLPTLATGGVLGSIELAHPLHALEELLKKTGRQFGMVGWCARLLQGDPQFIRRGR